MALYGTEFASDTALIVFTVFLLALLGLALWIFIKFRRSELLLTSIRRENGKLRNEVANITGWTADGRLPEDWQGKLRGSSADAAPKPATSPEQQLDLVLSAACFALQSIEPPYLASSDSSEEVKRSHQRNIDLVESLAIDLDDPIPALVNGDLDKLLCYWRRLESYFPDSAEANAYGFAAYALLGLLNQKDVQVQVPRPLSVANSKNCTFTTDDGERLRDISRIRTAAFAASSRLANLQGGEELVIDCERPGWSGPNGQVKPRILILDRSW